MRRLLPTVLLFAVTGIAYAGMNGGMGGMMGSQAPVEAAPHKAASGDDAGGTLMHRYCSQCHQAPAPSVHTASQWPGVVSRMRGYMQMQHRMVPNEQQTRLIVQYLEKSSSGG